MCCLLNLSFSLAASTAKAILFVNLFGIKMILLSHFLVNDYLSKWLYLLELTGLNSGSFLESHHVRS